MITSKNSDAQDDSVHWCLSVHLGVRSPLLSQASGGIRFNYDTAATRTQSGELAFPGTLIKGNIRHALMTFDREYGAKTGANTVLWLGAPSDRDDLPERGLLCFDDLWVCRDKGRVSMSQTGTRIQIEDETGTVRPQFLQFIELVSPINELFEFSGNIQIPPMTPSVAQDLKHWIDKALHWCTALGAFRGIGFGQLENHRCELVSVAPAQQSVPAAGERVGFTVNPDRPICFAVPRAGTNSPIIEGSGADEGGRTDTGVANNFESLDYMPAGAVRGALATMLRHWGGNRDITKPIDNPRYPGISQWFDQLHFTHALPVRRDDSKASVPSRPLVRPISLVTIKGTPDAIYDIALSDHIGLLNGHGPRFSGDWKKANRNRVRQQLPDLVDPDDRELPRTLRVRTAINSKTGAPLSDQLFSTECVVNDRYIWCGEIIFPDKATQRDREAVLGELAELLENGIWYLGKTSARAEIDFRPATAPVPWSPAKVCTLTLQSDTRLLPPGTSIRSTNGSVAMKDAYQRALDALAGSGVVELMRCFARHRLHGSYYIYSRTGRRKKKLPYNPVVLTRAGSVFVLQVNQPGIWANYLATAQKTGIDIAAAGDADIDWRDDPLLATNGFGEFVVDQPVHETHRIDRQPGWTPIVAVSDLNRSDAGE